MQLTIDILIIVLLVTAIVAIGFLSSRLYAVLGSVKQTLVNVETTRAEITGTLQRLEGVAETTEHLLREEIAPTLQIARQALVNVEITTRGLAETTQIVRGLAGKVDGAQKVFTLGGPIAQMLLKKAGSATGGFLSGVTAGIKMVLSRRKKPEPAPRQIASNGRSSSTSIALPSSEYSEEAPILLESSRKKLAAAKKR